ncbi:MAG: site-specific integrase [Acidimicrobiales bacterium]
MAWVEKLPSGRYRAVYRDSAGIRRSAGTWPHKAVALREAAAAERTERDSPTPSAAARMTWGEWEPLWSASRSVAKSTRASDDQRIRLWLYPTWGDVRLRDISPQDVQRWVTRLHAREGKAPTTVEKCYRLLSGSLRAAVGARLLTVSPCSEIRLPTASPAHDRYLTDEEVARILAHLEGPVELAVHLLVGTGLRFGEVAGLHWQSVDLDRATLDVVHSWDSVGHEIKAPKTHQRRPVPLSADLVARLRGAPTTGRTSCGQRHLGGSRCRSGLVVPGRTGAPLQGQNILSRDWRTACDLAGVRGARLHDLRHTYASRLVRAGVPLLQVSRLLGHGSITTTERYSHLATSQWDTVRAVLDGASAPRLPHVVPGGSGR